MDRDVRNEIYLSLLLLGADAMLLRAIKSTHDKELLADLRNWNEAKLAELREWLSTMDPGQLESAQQRIAQYESHRSLKQAA
jgi:CHASE3 domain sensor protein